MKRSITLAFTLLFSLPAIADMQSDMVDIKHQWAIANYQTAKEQQKEIFDTLLKKAQIVTKTYPKKVEPKIWLAIVYSTMADALGGFHALENAKKAHDLFLEAEDILQKDTSNNVRSMKSSVYISLATLYDNVPGWPISFGSNEKAEIYFKKAINNNPNNIDLNYFYGLSFLDNGQPELAIEYFNKALKAPLRPAHPIVDKARREKLLIKLAEAKDEL